MNFIEENIENEITLKDISEAARLSAFHFTRLFHSLVGETVSSYIRKRRLTLAAEDLLESSLKIIDIAFKYQFQSQAAFTRAFKKQFHITPARIKKYSKLIALGEMPPLDYRSLVHRTLGGMTLEPEISVMGPIKLAGMRGSYSLENNSVLSLWDRFFKVKHFSLSGTYGVTLYRENPALFTESDDFPFDYFVGCEVQSKEEVPEGLEYLEIPRTEYGVFLHRGETGDLKKTYDYIYRSWLPSHNREFVYGCHFEYRAPDFRDSEEAETLIYIPLLKEVL